MTVSNWDQVVFHSFASSALMNLSFLIYHICSLMWVLRPICPTISNYQLRPPEIQP